MSERREQVIRELVERWQESTPLRLAVGPTKPTEVNTEELEQLARQVWDAAVEACADGLEAQAEHFEHLRDEACDKGGFATAAAHGGDAVCYRTAASQLRSDLRRLREGSGEEEEGQ